jgi:hypothetical protein
MYYHISFSTAPNELLGRLRAAPLLYYSITFCYSLIDTVRVLLNYERFKTHAYVERDLAANHRKCAMLFRQQDYNSKLLNSTFISSSHLTHLLTLIRSVLYSKTPVFESHTVSVGEKLGLSSVSN